MRLAYLYLHSRQAERAVVYLALVALFSWVWHYAGGGGTPSVGPLPIVPPLGAAAVIVAGNLAPFGELETTMSHPLAPLRLLHMLGLLAVAVLFLAAANDWAHWTVTRNVAGLTGLALLAARLVGGTLAWALPLCFGIQALETSPAIAWNWPLHGAGDARAAAIAAALLLIGLGAIVPAGAPDRFREPG
jgi:hypothetical protein